MTRPKPKFSLDLHPITPEDLAKLHTLPPEQYLEHIKFAMLIMASELLKDPALTVRQRLQVLNACKRFIPK